MDECEINELVLQWQQRKDENAVTRLYNGLSVPFKYLIAHAMKGVDAESLLDEAFLKAINTFDATKGRKFISYLRFIFENDCREYRRRFKVRNRRDFICVDPQWNEEKENAILSGYNKDGKSTTLVLNESEREDLLEAISKLPERDAKILQMLIDGNTWTDVKEKLNVSKSTLNLWVEKAYVSLREVYA